MVKDNNSEYENKKVVFIGGCSRSGTTLLGSLLGSPSNCVTTPESQFVIDTTKKIFRSEIKKPYKNIKNEFAKHFRFKIWNIIDDLKRTERFNISETIADMTWLCVDLYAKKFGKYFWDTWIDHTPTHIKYINILSSHFPNSYFIHIVRDGRGVFSSVKSMDWGPAGVIQGANWWSNRISPGIAAETKFPNKVIRVRFEDLIQNTEFELQRICRFVDLKYVPEMISGNGFFVPKFTRNNHILIGKKPVSSVCYKWKDNLMKREIEIFESISGALLGYLGYELLYGIGAKDPTILERFKEIIFARIPKIIINPIRRYYRKKLI